MATSQQHLFEISSREESLSQKRNYFAEQNNLLYERVKAEHKLDSTNINEKPKLGTYLKYDNVTGNVPKLKILTYYNLNPLPAIKPSLPSDNVSQGASLPVPLPATNLNPSPSTRINLETRSLYETPIANKPFQSTNINNIRTPVNIDLPKLNVNDIKTITPKNELGHPKVYNTPKDKNDLTEMNVNISPNLSDKSLNDNLYSPGKKQADLGSYNVNI